MPSKTGSKRNAATVSLKREIAEFFSQRPMRLSVSGRWIEAQCGKGFDVVDPGKSRSVARVLEGEAINVDATVAAAQKTFHDGGWASMAVKEIS